LLVNLEKESIKQIYVIMNPVAGNASGLDIQEAFENCFPSDRHHYEIYETTGKEDLAEVTRTACERGADLIVAAGGDGTVAGVVNGLVHTGIPLGLVPLGTGNGLARALKIPLDPEDAIGLLAGENRIMGLDAMQVEDKYFILNVSAGVSAKAMRNTPAETKQRFGIAAYVWTIASELSGLAPRKFNLLVDGIQMQVRATEVLISNGTILTDLPNPLGPPREFNDSTFDVYIVAARTFPDYLRTGWELLTKPKEKKTNIHHLQVSESIRIEAVGQPQPAQGDGEPFGETPIEVRVIPDAIKVVVPKQTMEEEEK
jgi:diacylglycerol kinase (ATP)